MNWQYEVEILKDENNIISRTSLVKKLVSEDNEVLATSSASIDDFVANCSLDYQETMYELARNELNNTLAVLFPEGSPPSLAFGRTRMPTQTSQDIAYLISVIAAIGLGLQTRREAENG